MKSTLILVGIVASIAVTHAQMCFPDEYTCSNLTCIPDTKFCDGNNDCGDWGDEPEGCYYCPMSYFHCDNRNCVPQSEVCDGRDDCGDGSDEHECKECPVGQRPCPDERCVPQGAECQ